MRVLMCALVCVIQTGGAAEAKPAEVKPAEVKLVEVKLVEVKLVEVKLVEDKLVEVKLVEDKLVGQRPHPPRVRELQPRLFNPVAVWLQ